MEDLNFLKVKKFFFLIFFILFFSSNSFSQDYNFKKLVKLDGPWGSSFLNDNELIVTEKSGKIKIINVNSNKVSEIGWACGFQDPNYFARWFRKKTGQTPSQWRAVNDLKLT